MGDSSIYEGSNPDQISRSSGGASFGRITRVFPKERLCEVKTFGGDGQKDDNHIPKCQWISLDAHPEGDESAIIPRVNALCFVFFIGGEPFVFGFFRPLDNDGQGITGAEEQEELNSGDRIMKSIAGNKIILRSHGDIQIHSAEICKTLYSRDLKLIDTICRDWILRTDGGQIRWINTNREKQVTLRQAEYRDKSARDNVIVDQKGEVGDDIIHQTDYGVPDQEVLFSVPDPVKTITVKKDGETEEFIRVAGETKGLKITKKPDGDILLNVADQTTVHIKPTGEVNISVAEGKILIDLKPSGEVSLVCTKDVKIDTKGSLDIKVAKDVKVEAQGKAKIIADTVEIDGGGKLEKILTTPTALSDFTGLSIQPGSETVKGTN